MTSHTVQTKLNGTAISIETGKVAKQADGAVVVRCGGTMVLSTVVATRSPMEGRDFLPLTVEYREKAYAGGKIPGGFFKREGRPDEKETLTCRLIDRPIRPLFPKNFRNEMQVINLVISADNENDPDVLAMIGSSAALCLSGIPFAGPIGAVRVTMTDGKLVVNPTYAQVAAGTLELVMAATEDAVLMVESGGKEISEDQMLEALAFGHEHCKQLGAHPEGAGRRRRPSRAGPSTRRRARTPRSRPRSSRSRPPRVVEALAIHQKQARAEAMAAAFESVWAHLTSVDHVPDEPASKAKAREYFEKVEKAEVRRLIVDKGIRVDGRSVKEVRPIWSEVAYLPRAHGSALFTRGETQALVAATLGTKNDEQKMESFEGDSYRQLHAPLQLPLVLHRRGEALRQPRPPRDRPRGAGPPRHRRRAADEGSVPVHDPHRLRDPRVQRLLLDGDGVRRVHVAHGRGRAAQGAGGRHRHGPRQGRRQGRHPDRHHGQRGPLRRHGLQGRRHSRRASPRSRWTSRSAGVSVDIMRQALAQAREARLHVLGKMAETIKAPRTVLSEYAPRFVTIRIRPEKIREIIGPGGKVIRGIQEKTGAKIDVEDDGKVTVFSSSSEKAQMAMDIIQDICREAELDRIYLGKVKSIKEFGAFVEIMQGTEGLLHISQIAEARIRAVGDVLTEGDEVLVKVIEIDANGKVRLSRKQALRDQPALADKEKLKIAPTAGA